ncbi:MAG TPA: hypothetical protein VGI10_19985 [Polyangiaceae bacterium]
MKRGRTVRFLAIAGLSCVLAVSTGCRTSDDDVHRWANTSQGPRKLVAVLIHDKYPIELRVEAALTLVRMKPRSGRRLGIQGTDEQVGLIGALAQMAPPARTTLVGKLLPQLLAEIAKPAPVAQPGQPIPTDESVPYKDAAFAILTYEDGALMPDEAERKAVRAALAQWCSTNFSDRMDDSSQLYGIEQMLRELKADGVRALPSLIVPGATKIDRMADLIADFGDADTKLRASEKLVAVASDTSSDKWIKQKTPAVEAANKASKLNPNADQLKAQVAAFQEEELLRDFGSMKKIGGKPVVEFLLNFAQNKAYAEKRRAAALAALQGNLDKNNPSHAQIILTIAADSATPDAVRDVALQRVGEFPRSVVVGHLFELFKSDAWKVRWVAAELVLKMSDASQIPEFMSKLGQAEGMALTEPLSYGGLLADLKGTPSPTEIADKYAAPNNPVQDRLTALGFYYATGTAAMLSKVEPYAKDKEPTPKCKPDAKECEWKCTVHGAGGDETKDVKTVGDFVELCVTPAMQKRTK